MVKRLRLGRNLGIPRSILENIELEAARKTSRQHQKKVALEKMMSYWFEKDRKASLEKLADTLNKIKPHLNGQQDGQIARNGEGGQNAQNGWGGQDAQDAQDGQGGQNAQDRQGGHNVQNGQGGQHAQNGRGGQDAQIGWGGQNAQNREDAQTIKMLIWNAAVEECDIDEIVTAVTLPQDAPGEKLGNLAKQLEVKENRFRGGYEEITDPMERFRYILELWIKCKKVYATWNKLFQCLKEMEPSLDKTLISALAVTGNHNVQLCMYLCTCVCVCVYLQGERASLVFHVNTNDHYPLLLDYSSVMSVKYCMVYIFTKFCRL